MTAKSRWVNEDALAGTTEIHRVKEEALQKKVFVRRLWQTVHDRMTDGYCNEETSDRDRRVEMKRFPLRGKDWPWVKPCC
jgi:hypothetical protein